MVVFLLLLNVLCGTIYTDELVYSNYSLTFPTDNCKRGQQLLAYDDNIDESQPICSLITSPQLSFICDTVERCSNSAAIITNSSDTGRGDNYLVIDEYHVAFHSHYDCTVKVLCYEPDSECILPRFKNGFYLYGNGSRYEDDLLLEGERLIISCEQGYTWYWANYLSCIKMSTGKAQLSSDPICVPLSEDYQIQLHFNVSSSADKLPLLLGNYSGCFQTTILSLFLMGLQTTADIDLFPDYDTRPAKRDITTKLLNVRIITLELSYNRKSQNVDGVVVQFYLFHYTEAISPSIVTKVMAQVSRQKYDVVLESYCRLTHCTNEDYYSEECQEIPTMFFNSYPKPATPCVYKNTALGYNEPVPLVCPKNQYIEEEAITVCLFGDNYSPDESPKCSACGGKIYTDSSQFRGPSRADGSNARGAHCVWQIITPNQNRGQFYIKRKGDSWTKCKDPLNYIKLTEFDADGVVIKETTEVCLGVNTLLSSNFMIEFISNNVSELEHSFTFFFEPDLPPPPWYKKYLAILVAAPAIVLFFSGLVFLGVYCDNRNRNKLLLQESKSADVALIEYGDQISNGTCKPNNNYKDDMEPDPDEEEAISPRPRVHNAVIGPERRRKRKTKKRVTPNKTTDSEPVARDEDVLSPPTYDSWVLGNKTVVETETTACSSPDRVAQDSNQVFPKALEQPSVTPKSGEADATQPKKKKRRKKRSGSLQRPLPTLNGDVEHQISSRNRVLPPLQNNFAKEPAPRTLPPLSNTPDNTYPYVSDDLGVD